MKELIEKLCIDKRVKKELREAARMYKNTLCVLKGTTLSPEDITALKKAGMRCFSLSREVVHVWAETIYREFPNFWNNKVTPMWKTENLTLKEEMIFWGKNNKFIEDLKEEYEVIEL